MYNEKSGRSTLGCIITIFDAKCINLASKVDLEKFQQTIICQQKGANKRLWDIY